MLNKQQQFGKTVESIASGQLRKKGYKILAQNYRTSLGEIDIIARDRDVLVFIEVKARKSDRFGNAKHAVTLKKQRKIAMVALSYLKKTNQPNARARFDVVAVDTKKKDGSLEIIKNAFDLPSPDNKNTASPGNLYIVAMPIGNMEDITLRALRILSEVDVIAAEDTRKIGKLLAFHNIKNRLLSCHEHNEARRVTGLVEKLNAGSSVALVSDAGTPSVSDPGYRLVNAAIAGNIKVVPVPGPSAALAALSVSGLPTDAFVFIGFLPKKKKKRTEMLQTLATEPRTVLFYESPKRILLLLEEIMLIFGDRYGVLAREMTKRFEEFQRGPLSEILDTMRQRGAVKGECTLLVSGKGEYVTPTLAELREDIALRLKLPECRPSQLAKELAAETGLSRTRIYEEILAIKKES